MIRDKKNIFFQSLMSDKAGKIKKHQRDVIFDRAGHWGPNLGLITRKAKYYDKFLTGSHNLEYQELDKRGKYDAEWTRDTKRK